MLDPTLAVALSTSIVASCLLIFACLLWHFRFRHHDETEETLAFVSKDSEGTHKLTGDVTCEEFGRITTRLQGNAGTIRKDGTRSFLNGWFALDNSFSSSQPSATLHAAATPLQPLSSRRHSDFDDEWEVASIPASVEKA